MITIQEPRTQDKKKSDDAPPLSEFIDKLAEKGAVTVDGKTVDAKQLKNTLKDKNVAVSFGFQGCQGLCPEINKKHAVLEETVQATGKDGKKNSFVTMVVDVRPPNSGDAEADKNAREKYIQEVKDAGNTQHEVIGIFPKNKEDAKELQRIMQLFAAGAHSTMITLYDKDGNYIGRKNAQSDDEHSFKKWGQENLNKPATPTKPKEEKKTSILEHLHNNPETVEAMRSFQSSLVTADLNHSFTPISIKHNGKTNVR